MVHENACAEEPVDVTLQPCEEFDAVTVYRLTVWPATGADAVQRATTEVDVACVTWRFPGANG
jgi:hypothetical protein